MASADILNGPAAVPPEGVIPDFNTRPPHNATGYGITAACLAITTLAVGLRVYARVGLVRMVHLEDYLALAGYGAYIGIIYAFLQYIIGGAFYVHQWNIRAGHMIDLAFNIYLLSSLNAACVGLVKTAILLEWKRIFVPRGTRNSFFWTTQILLVLNTMLYVSGFFVCIFSCKPVQKWWDGLLPGKCINRKTFDVSAAACNFVWDIAIFLLPQRVIWRLQMTKQRKIGLSVLFSLGILSCICAAGRIHAMLTTDYPDTGAGDTAYTASRIWLWIVPEQTCVFLIFCVPSVPRVFDKSAPLGRLFKSALSWARTTGSRSTGSKSLADTFGLSDSRGRQRLPDGRGHDLGFIDNTPPRKNHHRDDYLSDTQILKTTEFHREEEDNAMSHELQPRGPAMQRHQDW